MTESADRLAAIRIERVGDAALLAVVGDEIDADLNAWVHRAASDVRRRAASAPALGAPVPGYASILVPFNPELCSEEAARDLLIATLHRTVDGQPQAADGQSQTADGQPQAAPSAIEIRVRYGGPDGPDLADVAARTGLAEADVIRVHSGTVYRVFLVGFVPGFPYLGVLPDELALPRRPTPRLRVPAGSVAIAGRQTGIYPAASPGGWHLIGRTDAPIWDPHRDPPALLAPGDRVRFVPS
ncbi:MAG: 5-oxoprolinase subunit PxpB [Chloroflexota bacterium]